MNKKELIFSFFMAGGMSLTICLSNAFYGHGFCLRAAATALSNWWFEYLCGFTLVNLFVTRLALVFANAVMGKERSLVKGMVVMPTFMVFMMVPMMSFLVQFYLHGLCDGFSEIYIAAIKRNYIFAWTAQVFIVGPIVKGGFAFAAAHCRPSPKSIAAE